MANDYNLKENPIAFLIQGLAHANPEYRAMRERRSRDRQQQEFDLKKQDILIKARESLWKKKADVQVAEEEQTRKRERREAAEKKEAMMVGLKLARGREQQMGPGPVELLPGVTGTDMRPLTIDAPGAGAQNINAQRIMDLVQGGASLGEARATASALGPQKAGTSSEAKQLYEAGKISFAEYKKKVLGGGQTINVFTGKGNIPIPKESRKKIADRLIELRQEEGNFQRVKSLYKPKFSSGEFQLKSGAKRFARRWKTIGGAVKWTAKQFNREIKLVDPEQAQYLRWRFESDMMFFKMRKWITGVAGGALEMAQIKKFLPSEADDALTYWNKLNQWELGTKKASQLLENMMEEGLQKGFYPPGSTFEDIPEETRENILARAFGEAELELQGYTPEIAQQQRDKVLDGIVRAQ